MQVIQSLTTPYKPKVGPGSADSFENGVTQAPNTVAGSIESMMSVDLAHPNIVQTFKSTSRAMMVSPEDFRHVHWSVEQKPKQIADTTDTHKAFH